MADRTAEEWGRIAVGLPGWRWMAGALGRGGSLGQLTVRLRRGDEGHVAPDVWPDPDDPATAGCLLALLGGQISVRRRGHWVVEWRGMAPLAPGLGSVKREVTGRGDTLGRACIAAAEALGRWPGGEG